MSTNLSAKSLNTPASCLSLQFDENKIIDYVIITDYAVQTAVDRVKLYLVQGWQPLGGASVHSSISSSGPCFSQAMVRYNKNSLLKDSEV